MRNMLKQFAFGLATAAMIVALPALASDGRTDPRPPPPPCIGDPICIAADGNGNLWVCGPSGICIPWTTSQPPLEP